MRDPRVLVLDHTAQEGGAEIALLRLTAAVRDAGVTDPRVLLFADGPLVGRLSAAGVRVRILPLDERVATTSRASVLSTAPRAAVSVARFIPRVVRAIRGSGADLVVANSLKAAVVASVAAPLAGRPWAWHLHDRLAPDYLPRVATAAMRLLAALGPRVIVANSLATSRTLPAAARRKAVVAYPGLPSDAFAPSEQTGATELIGIVGRVSPTKGQREFLEAAARAAADHPDARFVIVGGALFGEEAYERELHTEAERLGIQDRVEFTGWVPDAGPWLRRLTVLVHASPVPEPFGQVVVEAMAARIPVVAAEGGGVPEILDPRASARFADGVATTATGILVRPGDPLALSRAIGVALSDPGASRARADAAYADAAERFTISTTASVVQSAWARAVGSAPAPSV